MQLDTTPDPFRAPDWRWERARWLREHGRYARRGREDPLVLVARRFQGDEARARADLDRAALARKYPGLAAARDLYRRSDHDARWALEGYLLGRATPEQAAEYCNTTPEAVTWYEKVFYNVVPYLRHATYVVTTVMGKEVHHGLTERDHALLWKMLGYAFGHLALYEWIKPVREQRVRGRDEFLAAKNAATEDKFASKAFLAIHTIPVFNNQAVIWEAWNKAKEIAQKDGGAGGESLIVQNINASLCALPFVVGRQGAMDLPRLAHYDNQGVELRAHEQMQVACGKETDAHRQAVTWRYPAAETAAPPG